MVSNNSLICPLNDGIFYLSESATHQEYFLKHDNYYGTINRFVNVNTYIGNRLKSGLTVRHAYRKKINILLLKRRVPLNLLSPVSVKSTFSLLF